MTVYMLNNDQHNVDPEDNASNSSGIREVVDPNPANSINNPQVDASSELKLNIGHTNVNDDTGSSHSNGSQITITPEDSSSSESPSTLSFQEDLLNCVENLIKEPSFVYFITRHNEFETLLDLSIEMIKTDRDVNDELCQHFLSKTVINFFSKFFCDDTIYSVFSKPEYLGQLITVSFKLIQLIVTSFCRDNIKLLELLSLLFSPNTQFSCTTTTATCQQMHKLNSYAIDNKNVLPKYLIFDLINFFGNIGGFDLLLSRLRSNELSLNKILAYLTPINSCLDFLSYKTMELYAVPILETVPVFIQNLSDEDLKKEIKNEGKSDTLSCIIKILRNFSLKLPDNNFTMSLELLNLKILSRLLEISPFNGKMNALNELNKLITCFSNENFNRSPINDFMLTSDQMAQWLIENKVLEIVLKDYLHQFQYVEKLEIIIRFLIKENCLSFDCLDKIWNAQLGKHEIIIKNVHDLIAKLAWNFSTDQLNYLFRCFQSSWVNANKKEREKLLELMRRLAEDDKAGSMANQVLSLLWNIAFSDDDIDIIEQALNAHLKILDFSRTCDKESQKILWLEKCIGELSNPKCGNFVLPALKQMRQICMLFPESPKNKFNENISKFPKSFNRSKYNPTFRHEILLNLQNRHAFVALISRNLSIYMEQMKQLCNNSSAPIDPTVVYKHKRFSHIQEVQERLNFIRFFLQDGQLWLCLKQANDVWNCLAQNAVFDVDRKICFRWFTCLMDNDQSDLDPEIFIKFFEMNILKLDPSFVDISGIECFENFFNAVNCQQEKLLYHNRQYFMEDNDLIGLDYLWKLILFCDDEAAHKAIIILKNLYTNLGPKLIDSQIELHHDLINTCFDRLRASYDTLSALENDSIEWKMKIELIKATRVLTFLYEYINKCDNDFSQQRTIMPMIYSFRGNPILISIKITNLNGNNNSLELWTHTNESLFSIRNNILSRLKLLDNVDIELFYDAKKIDLLTQKFLCQLSVSENLSLTARIIYSAANIRCEQNFDNTLFRFKMDTKEENLPGVIFSKKSNFIAFLFKLADIGMTMRYFPLREKCLSLLKLIPQDESSKELIKKLCDITDENTFKNFETELLVPSTKSVYLLRLIYSMLFPANSLLSTESQNFQMILFKNKCGFQIINSLNNLISLTKTDNFCKISAILIILKISKFILSSVAYLKKFSLNSSSYMNDSLQNIPNDYIMRNFAMNTAQNILNFAESQNDLSLLKDFDYVPSNKTIDSVIQIAWATATGSFNNLNSTSTSLHDYFLSEAKLNVNVPFDCYEVCTEAIEVLTILLMLSPSYLTELIVTDMKRNFFIDLLLLCDETSIRTTTMEQLTLFFTKANQNVDLLLSFINLMCEYLQIYVSKFYRKSFDFFQLFCNLLNHLTLCNFSNTFLNNLVQYEFDLLKNAKKHFYINGQFESIQLEGHLKIMKHLVLLMNNSSKCDIGLNMHKNWDCESGFVDILLDDYLLTASKCLCNMQKNELYAENIDPICSENSTTVAAYELLAALCTGCQENLYHVCRVLEKYLNNLSVPSWEYVPNIDTRSLQGFVGLKNAGATCYMNSVLQQLFMISEVRECILSAKVDSSYSFDDDANDDSFFYQDNNVNSNQDIKAYNIDILKQIQIIFGHLLLSKCQYYLPKGFWHRFKMFGNTVNLRDQQDAVEFFNSLFDTLNESLKMLGYGTLLTNIFGGTFADQKICKGCPHRYSREESFTILIVDIRNHQSLLDSLEQYVKGDLLEGDNAYYCEKCDQKVDTVKRLCVKKLPKILTIQLKRFDYDFENECAIKFNDYFEFPRMFDMNPYTVNGLAEIEGEVIEQMSNCTETEENSSTKYELIGVVVHSGQATGGHYYSFVLHNFNNEKKKWFRFDDLEVTEGKLENDEELKNQCFGGEYLYETPDPYSKKMMLRSQRRWWNAFILVYRKIDCTAKTQCEYKPIVPLPIRQNIFRQNILFMHQKYLYSEEFYFFMRILFQNNIKSLNNSSISQEFVEKIAATTLSLASKFLFSFCFRTSKTLRGSAIDWYDVIIPYLKLNTPIRMWFIEQNLLTHPKMFGEFILECPATDVRLAFSKLVVFLSHYCLIDNSDSSKDMLVSSPKSFANRIMTILVRLLNKDVMDNCRQSGQYFNLFYLYATLGFEERLHLLEFNVPTLFMQIAVDEGPILYKNQYVDFGKLYQVVSQLIRCCDISCEAKSFFNDKPCLPNPFKHESNDEYIMNIQQNALDMLYYKMDYFVKILKEAITIDDNVKLICFCCWENQRLSYSTIREMFWHIAYSLNFELKPYFNLLNQLLLIEDSWQKYRFSLTFSGDSQNFDGIFSMLKPNSPHMEKRAYQCIQFLNTLFSTCPPALEILKESQDLKSKWLNALLWLKDDSKDKYSVPMSSFHYNNWKSAGDMINNNTSDISNHVNEILQQAETIFTEELENMMQNVSTNDTEPLNVDEGENKSNDESIFKIISNIAVSSNHYPDLADDKKDSPR